MGVAGLWEVLRPAGQVRSLTDLAVEDGFNTNSKRGFRIGIDASIWFFHAAYGREGENPELRTLFFRCCRLLQSPLLPLFVFDGPNRPAIKRGKRVGANAHWLTQGMRNIIDAFGFEWWVAPGEAEAELAYLNRIGIIDAVLSDDVDNFLFGATMIIRNPSNTLSGNRAHPVKNAQGKDDGNHVVTYTADAILSDPSVALSRAGSILIGLLSGGDYIPAGLPGCGQKFATGLARAGFGDSLFKAVNELRGARLDAFLDQWRQDVRSELKTNKSGLLPSKKPFLAASLPDDFPSLPVLMSYADPLTTENKGKHKTPLGVWRNDPDPMKIASLCELYFEWGVKDIIVHRFRTVLWPGIVCRAVRRVVIEKDTDRDPKLNNVRRLDGEEEETAGSSSPTKQISSTLSALTLSSPSKKCSITSTSVSDPPESFVLSSIVSLTSPASPGSSRSTSPTSASGPSPLLLEVVSQRTHVSTDSTLEYRVLVDPTSLVRRAESGVKGIRPPLIGGLFGIDLEDEDDGAVDQDADGSGSDNGIERLETAASATSKAGTKNRKARRDIPTTPLRLWLPACMVRAAASALVEAYEEKMRVGEEKRAKRGANGRRGGRAGAGTRSTTKKVKDVAADDESVPGPSVSKKVTVPNAKPKGVRMGGGRRKPKQSSEAQDDAYECIDLSAGESPCSSDGEGVRENTKERTKSKLKTTNVMKPKTSAKINATSRITTTSTMKEHFNTTKPSTLRATKSKPSTSRTSAVKLSTSQPATSKYVCEKEEEEESTDIDIPPALPKSSRPLDVLRAKSKAKSTIVYEKEETSPGLPPSQPTGLRPSASILSYRPAPQAKKKPSFVDVSDSSIEVNDIRRGTTAVHDQVDGDVNKTIDSGKTQKASGVNKSTIDPTPIPRPSTKQGHFSISRSAAESGEGEGDELPTFHRGSVKSRTKKSTPPIPARHMPQPFPMQLVSESPVSPCASRSKGKNKIRHDNPDDGGDGFEIVDVFTTPRGLSPPRSPTPSPSPAKPPPIPRSNGLPTSPANATSQAHDRKTKPRRHVSSDQDTHSSGNEGNRTPKSPRKSAAHSSPRHIYRAHGRASSPTPPGLSNSSRDGVLWIGTEGLVVSNTQLGNPGSAGTGGTMGQKPRLSDTSTIYISSGSEDEGNVLGIGSDHGDEDAEVSHDLDDWTDRDMGGWADTGMILSAPPSRACGWSDPVPVVPPMDMPARPVRVSKFKPALSIDVSAPSAESRASDRTTAVYDEETVVPRPTRRAPLLVARAKRNQPRDEDVIDLTSD